MVASIGRIASLVQGAGYFETDGCYSKVYGAHREASARGKDADDESVHRPGRDASLSPPKSVSLMAMVGATSGSSMRTTRRWRPNPLMVDGIRSFFRLVAMHEPEHAALARRVRRIRMKAARSRH